MVSVVSVPYPFWSINNVFPRELEKSSSEAFQAFMQGLTLGIPGPKRCTNLGCYDLQTSPFQPLQYAQPFGSDSVHFLEWFLWPPLRYIEMSIYRKDKKKPWGHSRCQWCQWNVDVSWVVHVWYGFLVLLLFGFQFGYTRFTPLDKKNAGNHGCDVDAGAGIELISKDHA